MHNPAPPTQEPAPLACLVPSALEQRSRRAGFSLIEVTLAIAIVAFAFVALIGLLPAGLGVFNQTMDSTNEMRITTDLTSLLQSTEYNSIPTNPKIVGNIFYFDVDGALLDTEISPVTKYIPERIYAAKILVDDQNVPLNQGNESFDRANVALRTLVVVARYNPTNMQVLQTTLQRPDQVKDLPRQKFRVLPLVLTKTDGKL